ncbi:uncharacterized protein PGTG_09594 [Puccinia graminis f. sp. tritici CRL 75-36-700-3]|uniref:Uncharacterized protein n=1 Tax=Puccinia graminis f. sp. tritici (strain CRL 75-36-700-3 / race SCCL) TaxID=418459 RepID=E3KHV6_PUCGT|nr:uncharacterized protein PGTG_09594 [Puccinia graminis f. sp. tritici CRL 75-36-700-3]EFP83881.1 hypothetical protein PGTG_09594 [Puccinia graminis f. sp. tritici CRL 75-36-700-3]
MTPPSRRFTIQPQSWSSEDELSAPPTVPISNRNRMIKEREKPLQTIDTIQQLAKDGLQVIECLNECDSFIVTDSKAARAREIVEQFRRETLYHHQPNPAANKNSTSAFHPQPFDRLIYLLDRYTEYCASIGLSAWPLHHLKVAIWIKGDVISLKTRVIPLRKTVRCYITTMETVRVKTRHLFPQSYEGDDKPLMSCPILKELLDVLPISRSASHDNPTPEGESRMSGGVDRVVLLNQIRGKSGDSRAEEALATVQASRKSATPGDGLRYGKKKPDPHMHTLSRYINFCRSLSIPMWPIEPVRVALWLRESVLSPASSDYNGFKVSLRTVQVYLSRLEYARARTEPLFKEEFGESATGSLYRSQAIGDILESFNPNQAQKLGMLTDAFQMEGSLHLSPVLGKRKIGSELFLDEAAAYNEGYRHCRPKVSCTRSSLATLSSEDSDSERENAISSRSHSPSPSCSVSYGSPAPTSSEQEFPSRSSSSTHSRKGCISYILCSEPGPNLSYESSHQREPSISDSEWSSTLSFSTPAEWSVPPINIPRIDNGQARFAIPSFDSFSFALSK